MPTIVHFEIPADDVERSKKFYSDLFGWKIEKFRRQTGSEDMEYWKGFENISECYEIIDKRQM